MNYTKTLWFFVILWAACSLMTLGYAIGRMMQ